MLISKALAFLPLITAISLPNLPDKEDIIFDTLAEPTADQINNQAYWQNQANAQSRNLCFIRPSINGSDDALVIQRALTNHCKTNSLVVFPGAVYSIKSPLKTMDLKNVQIQQFGRFLWTPDIDYWLSVSMEIGFQNQSTVWYFGGDSVQWDGHNRGTFDGNGQVWYDWAKSQGNLPHRPMNINWRFLTNSRIQRMRFVQSQMWTMATSNCKNVEFSDIYVNNTSTSQWNTLNTDGVDTINSDHITFRRWKVFNGDDSIALKGNSSNIFVYDSEFWHGQGFAIGSIGQYNGQHDYIENFYAYNTTFHDTTYAIYLKTWGGVSRGFPPNGGGGGLGYARNIVVDGAKLDRVRRFPIFSWQCENYSGFSGKDCNSSKFKFSDIAFKGVKGTMVKGVTNAGSLQCSSAAGGCNNVTVSDFAVTNYQSPTVLTAWHCENVYDTHGFTCNA